MEKYRLESEPFAMNFDTHVSLYRGISSIQQPVVVKQHDFRYIQHPASQTLICQSLNAALAQAKVQHPNSCDILEVQLSIQQGNCSVYHVLESLERSVGQDIDERRVYSEREMRDFMLQTSNALAYAHSKGIAHRDIKPANVFRTGDTYKVGDFGSFFLKQESSYTQSYEGDRRYQSPQLREAFIRGAQYNAFKADVFALGAAFLHIATLVSPENLLISENLDEAVNREIGRLPFSEKLRGLVKRMLAFNERSRPTMQEVYSSMLKDSQTCEKARVSDSEIDAFHATDSLKDQFCAVYNDQVTVYDLTSHQSTRHTLSVNFGYAGSYIQLERKTLLCLGAYPASSKVYALDLPSLQFTTLPSLRIPRESAGVAKANGFVYVFGSKDGSKCLSSCEKYNLSHSQWFPLQDMHHPRCGFTPCNFRALIYLPSAYHKVVETFNPETETFTDLSVCLPPQLWLERSSVAFIFNGELCLLTGYKQMACWKIDSEREFRVRTTDWRCWSTQPPLILDSLVFIAYKGSVEKFNLKSYTFI